ncbi:hypothetical protein QYF36_010205 [Acer negundo]|nr:hypothetical protein QYF36_010205 [Acer negundo]
MIRLLAEGVTGAEMRNDPGAAAKLPTDKQATGRDAEGVTGTKMRNDPMLPPHTCRGSSVMNTTMVAFSYDVQTSKQ